MGVSRSLPALGYDVGGTKVRAIAWDGRNVLAETVAPTTRGRSAILGIMASQARRLASDLGLGERGYSSVGVGIPGLVDPECGVVRHAINLDLDEWEMAAELSDALGTPVRIDNDLKTSVLGAVSVLDRSVTDVVYLNLGTGLSVGVMSGGVVIRGDRNSAGEFGHIAVFDDGEPCACGQRGCLESVSAGPAYLRAKGASDTSALDRFHVGVDIAIRTAVAAYDPEVILVGGGLIEHNPELFTQFVQTQRGHAENSDLLKQWDIAGRLAVVPLDKPVAAIGAAELGRNASRLERSPSGASDPCPRPGG